MVVNDPHKFKVQYGICIYIGRYDRKSRSILMARPRSNCSTSQGTKYELFN